MTVDKNITRGKINQKNKTKKYKHTPCFVRYGKGGKVGLVCGVLGDERRFEHARSLWQNDFDRRWPDVVLLTLYHPWGGRDHASFPHNIVFEVDSPHFTT